MSYVQAVIYLAIGYFVLPHTRNQAPMMQMGYAVENYVSYISEFVMYEAAAYQVFQATACWVAPDWATQ